MSKPPLFINADSGCNHNFIPITLSNTLSNVRTTTVPTHVVNPDGSIMNSTHTGYLNIPGASPTATKALVLDTLKNPLLSIGQLCDDGMTATFTKSDVTMTDAQGQLVLAGVRNNSTDQLFMFDLNNQSDAQQSYKLAHSVSTAAALCTPNPFSLLQCDNDGDYNADDDLSIMTHSVCDKGCLQKTKTLNSSENSTVSIIDLSANESIYVKRKAANQVSHIHAALYSPSDSTMLTAARRGYIAMFPGSTPAAITTYPPNSVATAQGHLDRVRQGIRSTKTRQLQLPDTDSHIDPDSGFNDDTTTCIDPKIYTRQFKPGDLHVDATGPFPVQSTSGNQFLLIFYIEGANSFKSIPMRSNTAASNIDAYDQVIDYCTARHVVTDFIRLDNNTSSDLERHLHSKGVGFQYVPPGNHRVNKAERGIRTYKNHFISGLCSADPDFDLALWDHLIPQADMTLNLLRSSAINPQISAYEQMEGPYDYSKHPIHRPGCKVVSLVAPDNRGPYSPHGDIGYYLGPALDHYRCFHVWIPKTRAHRITDSISFHPFNKLLHGQLDPHDMLLDSIATLTTAIDNYLADPFDTNSESNTLPNALRAIQQLLAPLSTGTIPDLPTTPQPEQDTVTVEPDSTTQRVRGRGDYYTIDHIVKHRRARKDFDFLIHWLGYPHSVDQWQTLDQVRNTAAYLQYIANHPTVFAAPTSTTTTVPIITAADLSTKTRRTRNSTKSASSASTVTSSSTYSPLYRANATKIASEMHTALSQAPSFTPDKFTILDHIGYLCNATNFDPDTGDSLKWKSVMDGPHRNDWIAASDAEFERLFITHDTMRMVHLTDIPKDRLISYFNPQLKMKLNADLKHLFRMRGTYGGNRSDYEGDKSAYTADMPTVKILLNRTVSDPDRKWMTADIVDMYLHTRLQRKEYMAIDIKYMSEATRLRFKIYDFLSPGDTKIYVEILGGIYGLPQAGLLAQEKLFKHLNTHGFFQAPNTTCLFRHSSLPIEFTLVVDDFGISYKSKDAADYLVKTLKLLYPIKVDWTGSSYLGYTVQDSGTGNDRTISLSMPRYIEKALKRFNIVPTGNVKSPEHHTAISYATKEAQMTANTDTSQPLSATDKTRVQSIVGVMLFYARAVDGTMLGACGRIASQQATPTQRTLDAAHHLLEYAATYPDASLVYKPSDMILRMDSDASYNSETGARSRASYCAWLGKANDPTFINGFVDVVSAMIPTVVTAASEAEYAALFITGKGGLPLRNTLDDLHCIQPPTIIYTDNSTAKGIATNTCKAKRSKSMDMRYHWIRERVTLKDFDITWHAGIDSLADLTTKVQPVAQVLKMRGYYVKDSGPHFSTTRSRRNEARTSIILV